MTSQLHEVEVDQTINFFERHEQTCAFIDRDENSSGNAESSERSSDCDSRLNKVKMHANETHYIHEPVKSIELLQTRDKNGCDESYNCSGSEDIESPAKSADSEDENYWVYGRRVRVTKPISRGPAIELKELNKSYRDQCNYDEIVSVSDSSDSSASPVANHTKSSNNNNSKPPTDALLSNLGAGNNCHGYQNRFQIDYQNKNQLPFPNTNSANKISMPSWSLHTPDLSHGPEGSYVMPAEHRDKFSKSNAALDSLSQSVLTENDKTTASDKPPKKNKVRKVKDAPIIDSAPKHTVEEASQPQMYPNRSKSTSSKSGSKKGRQTFIQYPAKSIENNRGSDPVDSLLQYINGTDSSKQKKQNSLLNGYHDSSERSKNKSNNKLIKSKKAAPTSKSMDYAMDEDISKAIEPTSNTKLSNNLDNSSIPQQNGLSNVIQDNSATHIKSSPSPKKDVSKPVAVKKDSKQPQLSSNHPENELEDKLLSGEFLFTDYSQLATQDTVSADNFVPVLGKKERRRQQQQHQQPQQKQVGGDSFHHNQYRNNRGNRSHAHSKFISSTIKSQSFSSDSKTSTNSIVNNSVKQNARSTPPISTPPLQYNGNHHIPTSNDISASDFPPLREAKGSVNNDVIAKESESQLLASKLNNQTNDEKLNSTEGSVCSANHDIDQRSYSQKLKSHSAMSADNQHKSNESNPPKSGQNEKSLTPAEYSRKLNENLTGGNLKANKVVAYGPLRDYMFKLWTSFQSELERTHNGQELSC